jgi:hypothetical protein
VVGFLRTTEVYQSSFIKISSVFHKNKMEKFNYQEYRKDLADDLKKIPDHEERAEVAKKEQETPVYEKAEAKHRENIDTAFEKRDESMRRKLESAGLVLEKADYDNFVSNLRGEIQEHKKEHPDGDMCTCMGGDRIKGKSSPYRMAQRLLGEKFADLAQYMAQEKISEDIDQLSIGECAPTPKLLAAVESLEKIGIIVTLPQEKLPLSQFKKELNATTTWSTDESANTIGYRNFLSNELKSLRDREERKEMLDKEKGSLTYKREKDTKLQDSKEYLEELEKFKKKVTLTNMLAEKLHIDKEWHGEGQHSKIQMKRHMYMTAEMHISDPRQFVEATKLVAENAGKVYVTLELSGDGKGSEMRMWIEEPVIAGPRSGEAIHYTPNIHGRNGSETFIAGCYPNYTDAERKINELIESGEFDVQISNEYDLTSGNNKIGNVRITSPHAQRSIKSELITVTKKG